MGIGFKRTDNLGNWQETIKYTGTTTMTIPGSKYYVGMYGWNSHNWNNDAKSRIELMATTSIIYMLISLMGN